MESFNLSNDHSKDDYLDYSGPGLSTKTALIRLHDEIEACISEFEYNHFK